MAGPDLAFWQQRFEAGQTPWDRGVVNPQLLAWLDAGALEPCRILVPGCGSGHEVLELARRGFDVVALDFAPAAVQRVHEGLAGLGEAGARASAVCADALQWQPDAPFDAVYEQTCLCSIYPDHWVRYAQQLHDWLKPGGRLFALFVQVLRPGAAEGFIQGPPYHCDIHGMRALLDADRWQWPKPRYPRVEQPSGAAELAVVLQRR